MAKILQLGGIAAAITRLANRAYDAPGSIAGVDISNYPTASQPLRPIGPPGSKPLAFPYYYGQNLNNTPRSDAVYTAADLRALSMYPLARVCIDNTKDVLGQIPWQIQLKQRPGEKLGDVQSRRKKHRSGDEIVLKLSRFLERPNSYDNWSDWVRKTLEDMLVCDAASTLVLRNRSGEVAELHWTSGAEILRYVDDYGLTPNPPGVAYAQMYQGMNRIDLTTDDLIYRPRNIVPRSGLVSSFLYGCSPVEGVADEIKVGMARLGFTMAFYDKGSLGNMIHVVRPGVDPDRILEAMQSINSQMAGNLAARRQYRIIQGFQEDGKPDQILFPKDPTLADQFDELHIRKISFALHTSPQRLLKPMNRSSANSSQQASQEEDIKPLQSWMKEYVDNIIQVRMGYAEYELVFQPYSEADFVKRQKADASDVHEGIRTRDEVREDRGEDPLAGQNRLMGVPTITTANGVVELGDVVVSGKGGGDGMPTPAGGDDPSVVPPKPKPAGKANGVGLLPMSNSGRLIERGE